MAEVLVEQVGRTCLVTINRPAARNALTVGVLRGITEALEKSSSDPDTRCVVLTGAGGHFCAGADLRQNAIEDPDLLDHLDHYMDVFHGAIKAMIASTKIVVGMLDGAAVGFGADMAFACDLRVASETAYVQEKFVPIGLMPDGGGTFWLPRLVGTARAMQWILLSEKIESKQLRDLGLVVDIVPQAKLRERTLEIASRIENGPPLAFTAIRQSIYASWGDVGAALLRERREQIKLLRSKDAFEGILAWSQKRTPDFKGH